MHFPGKNGIFYGPHGAMHRLYIFLKWRVFAPCFQPVYDHIGFFSSNHLCLFFTPFLRPSGGCAPKVLVCHPTLLQVSFFSLFSFPESMSWLCEYFSICILAPFTQFVNYSTFSHFPFILMVKHNISVSNLSCHGFLTIKRMIFVAKVIFPEYFHARLAFLYIFRTF